MSELKVFLRQLTNNPRQISAVAPSSRALARRMAHAVPDGQGAVVELGAGTGKITKELLAAGVAPERLHCFEINPDFCSHLERKFPGIHVHRDRAENIGHHGIGSIKAVVSGLPLLSMDLATQRSIINASFNNLDADGLYIQFTYGLFPPIRRELRNELSLRWRRSNRVWGNLPPATSYTFYRSAA